MKQHCHLCSKERECTCKHPVLSNKPSELFEGENSSLKNTYDVATASEILKEAKKVAEERPLREDNYFETKATEYIPNKRLDWSEPLKELYDTTGIPDEMKLPISNLRQWLNEDRITDTKKMVSNQELWEWLKEGHMATLQALEREVLKQCVAVDQRGRQFIQKEDFLAIIKKYTV